MQNFKVYLLIFCLTFLTKCTSYETATIIENETCKLQEVNGKTFLICDENNNLKVFIKKAHITKELKNCKKTNFALEKKDNSKKYTSIICKTKFGYEIVK
jgi:hypothetical protein